MLNLVRNVNEILAHLHSEMSDLPYNPDDSQEDLQAPRAPRALPRLKFTDSQRDLNARLAQLTNAQHALEHKLGTASIDPTSPSVDTAAPFERLASPNRRALQEFSINSSNGWKSAFDRFRNGRGANGRHENGNGSSSNGNGGNGSPRESNLEQPYPRDTEEEIMEVIASCREAIKALWEDDIVGEMLTRRKVRLEDAPGL